MFSIRVAFSAMLVLLALSSGGKAHALDQIVVGRSVGTAVTFTPLEIGERAGIWKRNGLSLTIISFSGDAQLQQALIAGTVQIGLGSGPALAFLAKGVPAKAIAALGGRPYNLCLVISTSSGVTSIEGLKGKKIGVTTLGSLSHWLVLETSRRHGWKGADALVPVPLGSQRAQLAALRRGQITGYVTTAVEGFTDALDGRGRIALNFGDMLKTFITHVCFARDDLLEHNPDAARRFLLGWRETIRYMQEHRDQSVQLASTLLDLKPAVMAKAFPDVMATLSTDLTFDPQAVATLSRSFTDLGILPGAPDMSRFYTNRFVPASH